MHWVGDSIEGLEHGNAWALRDPAHPATNWLVGDHAAIPADSLRFLRHGGAGGEGGEALRDLAVKWFVHQPSDDPAWGENKPLSTGCTLSLLASPGAFELRFRRGESRCRLLLDQPGDFAIWGEGLEHRWRALQPSAVLTVRWSLASAAESGDGVQSGEC